MKSKYFKSLEETIHEHRRKNNYNRRRYYGIWQKHLGDQLH